jgi:hypothetical protein
MKCEVARIGTFARKVLAAVSLLAMTGTAGCGGPAQSERLAKSRQVFATEKAVAGNVIQDEFALDGMRRCLGAATPESLTRGPQICLARLFHEGGGVTLIIYWIGNEDAVDSVRLAWKGQHEDYIDLIIDSATRKENQKGAPRGVIFPAVFRFPLTAANSAQIGSVAPLSVLLLKSGMVVSSAFPVDETYLRTKQAKKDAGSQKGR